MVHSADLAVREKYKSAYEMHMAGKEVVAMCAKVFIVKNWEKITDWTELNVVIDDSSDEQTEYYNYKGRTIRGVGKDADEINSSFDRIVERNKEKHNPIKTITDVVLDTSDGDFSLTINGKQHMWICDDAVIVIADFIEKTLNAEPAFGGLNMIT